MRIEFLLNIKHTPTPSQEGNASLQTFIFKGFNKIFYLQTFYNLHS
jgi:hypothetical protein